ncbi:ATP-binding cassette domain-containing protein [Solimonas soli]|uniref:ATP-binding cassette domain-containing protein n=1 Tax=Solimonas soli TaxID=413479 RepID=UPI0004B44F0F|nr:ATP-binding cassette domain-containing protein [Solimonas soli]
MLSLDCEFHRGDFTLRAQAELAAPVVGICGPSGTGKSTLLAAIAGLVRPQRGIIGLDGEILSDADRGVFVPPHRRHFGLVFQDGQLFPHLSVRGNLLYGQQQLAPAQRRHTLAAVAELLEIGALLERRPNQLSGGERQRVALGRALLYSPRLLLLDEPLSSLDTRLKAQILPFLRRIRDETGIPMLYVTHARSEIAALGGEEIEMMDGRLPAAAG